MLDSNFQPLRDGEECLERKWKKWTEVVGTDMRFEFTRYMLC